MGLLTETLRYELMADTITLLLATSRRGMDVSLLQSRAKRRVKDRCTGGEFRGAMAMLIDAHNIRALKDGRFKITASGKWSANRIQERRSAREVVGLPKLY